MVIFGGSLARLSAHFAYKRKRELRRVAFILESNDNWGWKGGEEGRECANADQIWHFEGFSRRPTHWPDFWRLPRKRF